MKRLLILIIPLFFLVIGISTLSDYGINWDEPFHFNRGQSYLWYFLTGQTNYLKIPAPQKFKGASDFMGKEGEDALFLKSKESNIPPDPSYRRSYFQSDVFNFDYLIKNDGYGHPPTNDILASLFNFIFYHKLGILGDVESYHLFEIASATALIVGITVFTYKKFGGLIVSLVSSFSLASYPLFFSESHFNIKDPPQAAFYGISIILFYFAVVKNKWQLFVLSAISAGLALGTKFNVIFLPFIIGPWFLLYAKQNYKKKKFLDRSSVITLLLYPLIVLITFYIFWPYLWKDPLNNLLKVVSFYKDVGTSPTGELDGFTHNGFNLFAPYWIAITTPLPVLFLTIVGTLVSLFKLIKKRELVYLLVLTWFLFPIFRVVLPGAAIYTGVRHIMEFLPAMAILTGIGIKFIFDMSLKKSWKVTVIIVLLISSWFVIKDVARLHPNENVYFNQLVGGLPGAREKKIPYWGYNYGNVYLQGVNWLNAHAEPNAKLGLAIVNMVNIPRSKLRSDIDFSNSYPSGPKHQGEYVMEMSNNWGLKIMYSYLYYETYLSPVYEVKVDGVSLLTIWKNDSKHLKEKFKSVKEKEYRINSLSSKDNILTVDFGKEITLTRLEIKHSDINCLKQKGGYIRLSSDNKNWVQEPEGIDYPQIPVQWLGSDKNNFVFLLVNKKARYLFLDTQLDNSCILNAPRVKIFGL